MSACKAFLRLDQQPVEWRVSHELVDYQVALAAMNERQEAISQGKARELVWLLEHPPIYTAGTSAKEADLLDASFPVYQTGRGGQYTYHGPGQRIAYVMLDLNKRKRDVRAYILALENWLVSSLAHFGISAEVREGRVGLWVQSQDKSQENKIAAIGVRIRKWVTMHGIALNVAPDLEHFSGIVPCGIRQHGVTSMQALGHEVDFSAVDGLLMATFKQIFGSEIIEIA